jgi:hypothetical protein
MYGWKRVAVWRFHSRFQPLQLLAAHTHGERGPVLDNHLTVCDLLAESARHVVERLKAHLLSHAVSDEDRAWTERPMLTLGRLL